MRTEPPLADVLNRFMEERGYSPSRLAQESRISRKTLHHWLQGQVKRPHTPEQLLMVAKTLQLSQSEATQLLRSAKHCSINELRSQATSDKELALLEPWRMTTPHNLPSQVTSFVGREAQLGALARLMGKARLVTLTGPGGSGKTRLALHSAANLLMSFPDGVFLVPLAPLTDPDLVLPAIAQSLGLTTSPGTPLIERVLAYLRNKQVLLVLDNFEKVVKAAPLVAQLLPSAAGLKLLVTSQVRLHLSAEHIFAVPPLQLPNPNSLPLIEKLVGNEAVSLFVERAQAVAPDFALTPANMAAVVTLCHYLEGLPLAIELAAARVPDMPLPVMVEQMSTRLALLVSGPVDLPERHQSLRGALGWSYDLLDQQEQVLFRRLAIFGGGCTLEAAEAICGGAPEDVQPSNQATHAPVTVSSGLLSLVHKSLLQQDTSVKEAPRFMLLETICEYALEQLAAAGEKEFIQRRHADFYLALAEAAAPKLRGFQQALWLERIEQDHDNLRAVLHWAQTSGNAETAIRLSAAIWPLWHVRGHWSEGRQWLEAALSAPSSTAEAIRAEALTGAATLALVQYDNARAQVLFEQSRELYTLINDQRGIAQAIYHLGWTAQGQRDHGRAIQLYQESLAQFQALHDQPGMLLSLLGLTWTTMFAGQLDQARSYGEAGVALSRELDDKGSGASILNVLGLVALYQRDYPQASTYYADALALYRALQHTGGISVILMNQGFVALFEGRLDKAASLYQESLALARDLHDQLVINYNLDGLAAVAGYSGQPIRAARLGGAAEALRERIGTPIPEAEQQNHAAMVAAVRSQVDDQVWTEAWSAGRALPLEYAIAEALDESQCPAHRMNSSARRALQN